MLVRLVSLAVGCVAVAAVYDQLGPDAAVLAAWPGAPDRYDWCALLGGAGGGLLGFVLPDVLRA